MDKEIVLEVKNLTKIFTGKKDFKALDNVNFSIKKGAICGFVGPNGAGKSTAIKSILGLLNINSGDIKILGKTNDTLEAKRVIGYMPEKDAFYGDLTPIQYLKFFGKLSGMSNDELEQRIPEVLELVDMTKAQNRKIKEFSSGMKKKILFAQAIIHKPEILILDEPTANLDPIAQKQMIDIIKTLSSNTDMTVFISSHYIEELEKLIDSIVIIKNGRILINASVDEVKDNLVPKLEIVFSSKNDLDAFIKYKDIGQYVVNDNMINILNFNTSIQDKILDYISKHNISVESISKKKLNLWDYVIEILSSDRNE